MLAIPLHDVPPLPAPILSLGITGHRANNATFRANADRIAAAMAEVFDALTTATTGATGPVHVRLHSLLADGSDQLAATLALARGWELVAPLPFGQTLNIAINSHPGVDDARRLAAGQAAQDPEIAARATILAGLIGQAKVFALADADAAIAALFEAMLAAPGDVVAAQRYGSAASHRVALAGRVMIEQSDLIIAVWDGVSRDAVGGTGHTLASALAAGTSVILIDARNPEAWRLVRELEALDQPAAPGGLGERAAGVDAGVSAAVGAALQPASRAAAAIALAAKAWRPRSNMFFHAYRRVEALFGGGGRPLRLLTLVHETPAAIITGSGAPLLATIAGLPGADPAWPHAIGRAILQRFAWADGISTRFSDLYRGGMVANFAASGAAVLTGLAYLPTAGPAWKHVFALVEFFLLGTIVTTTALATRGHWHDRWFETRRAAEYLRHAPFLMALGAMRPPGRWPQSKFASDAEPQNGAGEGTAWPEHFARLAQREVGLPVATITPAWLRAVLDGLLIPHLTDQRDYHIGKAKRLEQVNHRLDTVSTISFQLAVVAVAVWLLLWAGSVIGVAPAEWAEKTAKLFTFLGVLFPTLGGAIAGIRYFGDFDRFAAISRVSASKLDAVLRRAHLLQGVPVTTLDYGSVADLAHAADEVVISEIESWQAVFAGKHFTVPV